MLNPSGLDELWRIKKVMHPDNIKATKYVLFEEILSDKSIGEILMKPQPVPYYEPIDTVVNPEITAEFHDIAEELNKDIKYFQRNRRMKGDEHEEEKSPTLSQLVGRVKKLRTNLANAMWRGSVSMNGLPGAASGGISGLAGGAGGLSGAGLTGKAAGIAGSMASAAKNMDADTKKSMAKGVAAEAAKDIGRGLLRGFFNR